MNHVIYLAKYMASKNKATYMLFWRADTPPKSADKYVKKLV